MWIIFGVTMDGVLLRTGNVMKPMSVVTEVTKEIAIQNLHTVCSLYFMPYFIYD